jgi:hypothetical protein
VNLKNQKDFFSGLLFMLMGVAFAWAASTYTIGRAARMGPGYFPLLLGALLALLGGVLVFKALVFETEDGGRIGAWDWRAVLCILLANGLFGLLLGGLANLGLPPLGLLPAVFALTVLAGKASTGIPWKELLLLACLLALCSYGVCILLLQLPVSLWPAWPSA